MKIEYQIYNELQEPVLVLDTAGRAVLYANPWAEVLLGGAQTRAQMVNTLLRVQGESAICADAQGVNHRFGLFRQAETLIAVGEAATGAKLDRLTGLATMEQFTALAEQLVQAPDQAGPFAVVYFNVDNFKAYNDTYGYHEGDVFLCALAKLIVSSFPDYVAGRSSDDHFVVLTDLTRLEERVERVHRGIHALQKDVLMEVKAGIYVYEPGVAIAQAYDWAKLASDTLKGNYNRNCCYYDDRLRADLLREKYFVDNIDKAVEQEYLKVYYQPIVRVLSNKVCAMESLVRWDDPELGFLNPGQFIPTLERHHLIQKVDAFVLDHVCRDLLFSQKMGESVVPVSVNLSRLDFQTCDVFEMVQSTVLRYGLPARMIHLEVTESALSEDEEKLKKTLDRFRKAGFEVWLDDFGSEYSTLNTLHSFQFDLLKIDMKFFSTFETSENSRTIIRSIVDMGKRLHMRTLAEGIETLEQYEFLKKIGCDKAQGFFLCKPHPMEVMYGNGVVVEDAAEAHYCDTIGQINFLSPDPVEDANDPAKLYFVAPTAIIQHGADGRFRYLYTNDGYMDCLASMGIDSIAMSEQAINDDAYKIKTRLVGLAQKSHRSGQQESLDFIFNGCRVNLHAKEIAKNGGDRAYFVTMMNLSELENIRKIEKMETALNFLYSIYDRVDLLNVSDDSIENLYLSAAYYQTCFQGKVLRRAIEDFAAADIAEEDREKFLEFYDPATLPARIAQGGRDYIVQRLHTRIPKEGNRIQVYIIIRVDDQKEERYLSCVRDVSLENSIGYNSGSSLGMERDEEWYALVMGELHAGVFEWDLKNDKSYASGACYQYALSREKLSDIRDNRANLDTIYPDDVPTALEFFRRSASGAERAEVTLRLKLLDGGYRWCRMIGLFHRDENGVPDRTIGILLDQEKPKNLNQLDFINAIPTGVGVFEVRNGVTRQLYMNDGFYHLLDDSRENRLERQNVNFMNSILPEDRPVVASAMQRVIDGADGCTMICRACTGTGGYKWLKVVSAAVQRSEDTILVYSTYVEVDNEIQSRRAVEQSRRRLEAAIQAADMSVWDYDCVNHKIIQSDDSIRKHGFEREIANAPESLVQGGYLHSESVETFLRMYRDLHEKQETVQGDFRVRTRDGKDYWWEHITLTPVFDENGTMILAQGLSLDVTERKEKEEQYYKQLNTMESREEAGLIAKSQWNVTRRRCMYHSLANGGDVGPEMQLTPEQMIQETIARMPEEQARRNFARLMDPDRLLKEFAAGRTEGSLRYKRREDGCSLVYAHTQYLLSADPQSGDVMLFVYCYDESRQWVERQIVRRLGESIYEAIGIVDLQTGHYRMENRSAELANRLPAEGEDYFEECKRVVGSIVVPEEQAEVLDKLHMEFVRRELADYNSFEFVYTVKEPAGTLRRKKLHFQYLDDDRDTILYTNEDVTAIYRQEQEQLMRTRTALEEARQATRAKTEFLSRMSHDIRTPLNAILGTAILARDETQEPEVKRALEVIDSSGHFLLGLINDILDINKIESGKLELRPEPCLVSEYVASIEASIRPLMEAKHIHFDLQMNCGYKVILVDKLRHHQVFFNLLSNAAKYTPENGHVSYITTSIPAPQGIAGVRNTIRDDGIGMTEQYMAHLFEPFTRDSNAAINHTEGSGLGLAIVKSIVDAMHGQIRVKSEPGKGTEFVVDLFMPLPAQDTLREAENTPVNEEMLRGKHILLVEDNSVNTRIAQKLLTRKGCVVSTAENGREAVEQVELSAPGEYAAVLMDIRMPVMDGMDASRAIRRLNHPDAKTLPIIAMTADAFVEDVGRTREAGMNAHLAKPIEPEILYETLMRFLK